MNKATFLRVETPNYVHHIDLESVDYAYFNKASGIMKLRTTNDRALEFTKSQDPEAFALLEEWFQARQVKPKLRRVPADQEYETPRRTNESKS
jgi:hypothetical protein